LFGGGGHVAPNLAPAQPVAFCSHASGSDAAGAIDDGRDLADGSTPSLKTDRRYSGQSTLGCSLARTHDLTLLAPGTLPYVAYGPAIPAARLLGLLPSPRDPPILRLS
jgi:hypothetical protein